jgi:ankyrin repeat protein
MAAAAFQLPVAKLLVRKGAAVNARNRRNAAPLHYAADANWWNPTAQAETITYLLSAGAHANAKDANGATPLHRAVRTRSAMAVRALLAGGADLHATNNNGSSPFDLATRNTGRSGSGSPRARDQQMEIIAILIEAGGKPPTPALPKGRQ